MWVKIAKGPDLGDLAFDDLFARAVIRRLNGVYLFRSPCSFVDLVGSSLPQKQNPQHALRVTCLHSAV